MNRDKAAKSTSIVGGTAVAAKTDRWQLTGSGTRTGGHGMANASRAVEISGLRGAAALRARFGERVTAALEPIKLEPVSAHIAFFDDNGPKGGGIRCAFTVRLPYRPALRVEHTAETARLAFDGGFGALERLLERYREREREGRRHPKKYFVAKRLTEGLPAAARASEVSKGERRGRRKSS
jgi:hypothetical protein